MWWLWLFIKRVIMLFVCRKNSYLSHRMITDIFLFQNWIQFHFFTSFKNRGFLELYSISFFYISFTYKNRGVLGCQVTCLIFQDISLTFCQLVLFVEVFGLWPLIFIQEVVTIQARWFVVCRLWLFLFFLNSSSFDFAFCFLCVLLLGCIKK